MTDSDQPQPDEAPAEKTFPLTPADPAVTPPPAAGPQAANPPAYAQPQWYAPPRPPRQRWVNPTKRVPVIAIAAIGALLFTGIGVLIGWAASGPNQGGPGVGIVRPEQAFPGFGNNGRGGQFPGQIGPNRNGKIVPGPQSAAPSQPAIPTQSPKTS